MNDKRLNLLKNSSVQKAVNKLAMPSIVGLLVMSIYNIVDTMFVAWMGTEATAATQVVMPIVLLTTAIGLTFGIGAGSYVSRLLGKGDVELAEQTASTSFYTGLAAGFIFMIINYVFMKPIFVFFGANDEVMEMTRQYGIYILLGFIPLVLNMVLNNLLRSEGSAKLSMIGMVTGALLNIILDPLFIFTFKWGIAGAAIATTLSQFVSLAILLSTYLRKKTIIKIRIKSVRFNWIIFKEMLTIGLPTFFKQVLFSASIGLLNTSAVTYGGADMLAAAGIITRVTMLPANIIFGIGQGFQPVAGYNLGAGDRKRVMDAFKYTAMFSTIVAVITSLFFGLFARGIFNVFKASESVIYYGVKGIYYYSAGMLTLGFTNTITVFYQSIGKAKESLFMSIARQGVFFIPVIILLPQFIGIHGVFMSQLIADIITTIAATIMIVPFMRNKSIDRVLAKNTA